MAVPFFFLLIALILFIFAAFGGKFRDWNLTALGLAFCVLAALWGSLPNF